jgi:hypothetical protein
MAKTIALTSAIVGALLAFTAASLVLIQEASHPGASIFPMPVLVLIEWGVLGMAGAIYLLLAEMRQAGRYLLGAWAMLGAYLPLILLGAFTIGPYALASALLLLAPTAYLTHRHDIGARRWPGYLVIGALGNLAILLILILLGNLAR